MFFRQAFKHIDSGRYFLSLAILHRNRKAEFVKEHVAKLLRGVDVELEAATLIDVARLGVRLALQLY